MPANAFTIGKDRTLDIIDPNLGPQRFKILTGFEAAPQYNSLESKGLDGVPRFDNTPHGHKLTFQLDRADGRAEKYFAGRERDYFNGLVVPLVSITETTTEIDGSVTVFRYTGVSLQLTSSGASRGDAITTQTIEGMASRKVQVS